MKKITEIKKTDIDLEGHLKHKKHLAEGGKVDLQEVTDADREMIQEYAETVFGDQSLQNEVIVGGQKMKAMEALDKYAVRIDIPMYMTITRDMFTLLRGNRPFDSQGIIDIIKNIADKGLQPNFTIVNEEFKEIDGQHRDITLETINRLTGTNLPTIFVVAEGAGRTEVLALNTAKTKWKPMAYLLSNMDSEDEEAAEYYKKIHSIMEEYNVNLSGLLEYLKLNNKTSNWKKDFKNGNFVYTEEKEVRAIAILAKTREILKGIYGEEDDTMINKNWLTGINTLLWQIGVGTTDLADREKNFKHILKKISANNGPVKEFRTLRTSSAQNIYEGLAKIFNFNEKKHNKTVYPDYKFASGIAKSQRNAVFNPKRK